MLATRLLNFISVFVLKYGHVLKTSFLGLIIAKIADISYIAEKTKLLRLLTLIPLMKILPKLRLIKVLNLIFAISLYICSSQCLCPKCRKFDKFSRSTVILPYVSYTIHHSKWLSRKGQFMHCQSIRYFTLYSTRFSSGRLIDKFSFYHGFHQKK